MEGTVILIENPKVKIVLEKSGGIYWVRGLVYYPVPEAYGEKVITRWFFRVEGEMSFLVEKVKMEEERKWSISRIISTLYSDRDIFLRDDEGEKNYERLIDHLEDEFRKQLDSEIRSTVTNKFQVKSGDIIRLLLFNVKIALRRPKNRVPVLSFGATVHMDLWLPVKFFYDELSDSKDEVNSRLFFFGEAAYRSLPRELKDSDSVTKLLTETFPIMKKEYRLIPQRGFGEVELWGIEILKEREFGRAALSTLDFQVPITKDFAETLLRSRGSPEEIVMKLITFLSFFPEGKLSVGKMNYYTKVHENNQFEMFYKTTSVSELVSALRMFYEYVLKGEVG